MFSGQLTTPDRFSYHTGRIIMPDGFSYHTESGRVPWFEDLGCHKLKSSCIISETTRDKAERNMRMSEWTRSVECSVGLIGECNGLRGLKGVLGRPKRYNNKGCVEGLLANEVT